MPFGIGRSLKRAGRRLDSAVRSIGSDATRLTRYAINPSTSLTSDLGRGAARSRTVREGATLQGLGVPGGDAIALGSSGLRDYEENEMREEQAAYQRQADREAAERAKKEAERGAELLRRRRLRRLGTVYASGFGSASTDFKTVLGI